MLFKVHLSLHSRISGSRWVITSLWLSGSWRSFLYNSSVYSCHLLLISSAYVMSIPLLSFIQPIFAWNVSLISLIFLKRSLVFPILFFPLFLCIDCWGRLSYLFLLKNCVFHKFIFLTGSLQPGLTLCDPMNCSPPGSSVHGILYARILEWVAMPSSRGSSQPRDWTHVSYVSCIGRHVLYH